MPVATAQKVEALRADFRSAAQLADLLGVSRSQVTRWLRGAGIDPLNAEKVDLLELVWSNVLRLYERDAALAWLFGVNPLLATAVRSISFAWAAPRSSCAPFGQSGRTPTRDPLPLLRLERPRGRSGRRRSALVSADVPGRGPARQP